VRADESLIKALTDIAKEASALILEVYATDFSVSYKAPKDPVTEADRRANELICTRIAERWFDVPIVAEESDPKTFENYRSAPLAFFVDPLDGTREFVAKNGEFVVMIGLIDQKGPLAGVIHAPVTGAAWAALRGSGAFTTKQRALAHVSTTSKLDHARIVSTRSHRSPEVVRALDALGARTLDSLGSAGLKCAEVAMGTADAYVAPGIAGSRWDLCAGQAIIEAAGGRVTDAFGDPIDYRDAELANTRGFIASNGVLHDEIVKRLASVRS
jgi:3'(2'), 5'-bisphosphate nucleotidase